MKNYKKRLLIRDMCFLLLVVMISGCNITKNVTSDPLCKRYFDRKEEYLLERRAQVWKKINLDLSENMKDYIFVEIGDTNFESYDYIYIGINDKQGIILSSYPYRKIKSSKVHRQEHVAYVELNKMKNFFNELNDKIDEKITFRKNSLIKDGACYSFKFFINNRNIEYSAYMPRLFPTKEVKMINSDIIASFIYKFFEKIEISNDRYIRRRVWYQNYKNKVDELNIKK